MNRTQPRGWFSQQWQWLCLSLSFLTRIPVRIHGEVTDEALARCHRWFSLTGLLIGLLLSLVYWCTVQLVPVAIAVVLTLAVSFWLTGALHEDGLADCVDGMGGGQSIEQRLAIMKDSRVGSYGVLALIISVVGRLLLLDTLGTLSTGLVVAALMTSHSLSRGAAALIMGILPYLRRESGSSSKVQALTGDHRTSDRGWLAGIAGLVALVVAGPGAGTLLLLVTFLVSAALYVWLKHQLGGVTGDALGAVQQMVEIMLYLTWVAIYA